MMKYEGLNIISLAAKLGVGKRIIYERVWAGMPIAEIVAGEWVKDLKRYPKKIVTYKGRTQILSAWIKELGLDGQLVRPRIAEGWSPERAFETPKTVYRPKSIEEERAINTARCKAWRAANREKFNALARARARAHRERATGYVRKPRLNSEERKEKARISAKAYYEANKEKILARYHAEDIEIRKAKRKAYYEANREEIIAIKLARYHAKKAAQAEFAKQQEQE